MAVWVPEGSLYDSGYQPNYGQGGEGNRGERWLWGSKEYRLITALDIRNAFNSASWHRILHALQHFNIPSYLTRIIASYLSDRKLWYTTSTGTESYEVTGGVPRISARPHLVERYVRRSPPPKDAGRCEYCRICRRHSDRDGREAPDGYRGKDEYRSQSSTGLAGRIGDTTIRSQATMTYLGVKVDNRLNFRAHLMYAASKAATASTALARIMPNTGGPRQKRRLLLTNVVRSISLYAALIWPKGTESGTFLRQMNSVHRICALRMCCAFRTVSGEAAMVLAGTAPFDLQATERAKARDRASIIQEWQARWNSGTKGRWTHRLVPDISRIPAPFRPCIRSHCAHCEPQVVEDAEHVFLHCGRFAGAREQLEARLEGQVETESVVEHMISSREKWVAVNTMAVAVMKQLRREERARIPANPEEGR
ncbi:uncharacterized protein LOC132797742 [Drosophila nasuta]|uniref:uncharacterized protein LOC132797742 n=1 Tax=Drosophila nasuta TaxID=42062 RepID=UPI00295E4263|nr:uncharacterized protein LOC132797742 [Drosophila nasuta]